MSTALTVKDCLRLADGHIEEMDRILNEDVHILMVEDDPAQNLVYELMFKRFSCNVTYVTTGAEALRALATGCMFDIVMVDLRLENCITGVDVLRRVDKMECEGVVVTGDVSQLQQLGYDGVATVCFKPMTLEKLAKILKKVRLPKGTHGFG